jgi:hypothetical protein
MYLYWVYDLPKWLFCLLTITFFLTIALTGQRLLQGLLRDWMGEADHGRHNEVVGHYLAAYGVFYGITLGLISAATWANYFEAETKVAEEAAAMAALFRDLSGYPEPSRTELMDSLRDYLRYEINEAWAAQRRGLVPRSGAGRIGVFQQRLLNFEPTTERQKTLHEGVGTQFTRLSELRQLRLESVTAGLSAALWWVIFIGAVLNIALTWLFVTEKKLFHDLLTGLLATLLGLLIFLLASLDNPYRGQYSVDPEAFVLVYEQLMKK